MFREELYALQDQQYQQFHSRLCPGVGDIIGIHIPVLRQFVKRLWKEHGDEILNHPELFEENGLCYPEHVPELYEERLIKGMLLGIMNCDLEPRLSYLNSFIPQIDNWAICDITAGGLHFVKKNRERVWEFLQPYLMSEQEYELRFAVVMILNYYLDDEYLEASLSCLEKIRHDGYYVKMAVAWAISVAYVKHPQRMKQYLKEPHLGYETYRMAIRKIKESNRISRQEKEEITAYGKIHAVIFDMDGVLLDTEKYLNQFWREAAAEYGFKMTREHGLLIRSLAGEYAAPYMKELLGETFDYETVRNRRKELMQAHLEQNGLETKPGGKEILSYLRKKGYKLAIATATDEKRAHAYLKETGLYSYFDDIVCATMVEHGKPQPDVYLEACRQIGEAPEHCVAVEDSPNGILAAYRAGCKPIMVPDLAPPDEETKQLLYAQVESLEGIREIL
ncbi:MAG: HAD-IA family hydrolase [Lachnospiraceae bacterium]